MVFVAVDCEAYERDQHRVTEVGIATLDTRDLHGLPPGKDAKAWGGKIKARHFRVKENSHLTNTDFVPGCPDRFEFGETQWIGLRSAAQVVGACIRSASGAPDPAEPLWAADGDDMYRTGRNIVLVGQAVDNDIAYLEALGYIPRRVQHFIEGLDLGIMDREVKGLQQSRNLASILYDVNIYAWNLHNAGNDAVYTLQAMLALALRQKPKTKQEEEEEEEEDDDDDDDDDDEMEGWDGIPEMARREGDRQHQERQQQQQAGDLLRAATSTEQVLRAGSYSDSDSQSDGGVPLPADIATFMPTGDSDSVGSSPGSPTATRSTSTANNNNNNNNNNNGSNGSKNSSDNTTMATNNNTSTNDDNKDFW